ncbi:MAG: hypothetical protein NTX08_00560 [Sphingobacteriales bacterium]|nr:hypothetical protein [Sphingobacteriales bacterium]
MKKNIAAGMLSAISLLFFSFISNAQQAKVTITINSLIARSSDACNGKMDFYAKVYIGHQLKTFPVREGNDLRGLNWQFSVMVDLDTVNTLIEIWDEDDAICGGGDDEVTVKGDLNKIRQPYSTSKSFTQHYTYWGSDRSGAEKGGISYTVTVEPTKPGLLTRVGWKLKKTEYKTGSGPWEELIPRPNPECNNDDYFFYSKNFDFGSDQGAIICNPADPQRRVVGSWDFLARETWLQIKLTDYRSAVLLYTVEKLDENNLVLTHKDVSHDVTTYTRSTYGH